MKKEDQHIDHLFQKLKGDSFEVPPVFLDDLKLRMDAKQAQLIRRKRLLWFIMLLLTLLGIAAISYANSRKDSNHSKSGHIGKSADFKQNESELEPQNQTENVDLFSKSRNKNSTDLENVNTEMKHALSENSKEKNLNVSNQRNIASVSSQKNERDLILEKETNLATTRTTTNKRSNYKSQKEFSSTNKEHARLKSKELTRDKDKSETTLKSKQLVSKRNSNNEIGKNASDLENTTQMNKSEKSNETLKEQAGLTSLTLQMKSTQALPNLYDRSLAENKEIASNEDVSEDKANKKLDFELQIYSGAGLTSSKFVPTISADEFQSNPFISANFGLKTNLLYQNIYGSAGIEYFKSGDKLKFNTYEFQQVGTDSLLTNIIFDTIWIDSNQFVLDSMFVYETTPIFDSIAKSNTNKNQYAWISIPISFGYRFQFNSWDVIPNLGVNFNFGIAKNSGEYPNSDKKFVKYDALKFNMDIRVQTEIRKNFGNLHVFVSPYFKKNFKPIISNPSLRLTQKNWGLNVGVGIKF